MCQVALLVAVAILASQIHTLWALRRLEVAYASGLRRARSEGAAAGFAEGYVMGMSRHDIR